MAEEKISKCLETKMKKKTLTQEERFDDDGSKCVHQVIANRLKHGSVHAYGCHLK